MSNKVELYVYDLSRGMASSISPMLLGKRIDGIWHTSIVVYEREYFFGSGGVESCTPGTTALGSPLEIVLLGETQVPYSVFFDYLNGLGEGTYAGHNYKLLSHNCNVFSNDIAQFLCGSSIPRHILDLPNEILQTRLAPLIEGFVSQLEQSARPIAEERTPSGRQSSPDFEALNSEVEATRYMVETGIQLLSSILNQRKQ